MSKSKPKILLIDDHLLFAEGLKAQLTSLTAAENISILNDGSQFVRQLAFNETFSLYIFDLSMPNIDGFDLIRKLVAHNPDARILIVSAASDHKLALEALALGALGFVSKSASPETMREGVKAVLTGEQYLDPSLNALGQVLSPFSLSGSSSTSTSSKDSSIPPRTLEVLKHMANGHTNKSIADLLTVTEPTVKWHVSRLFELFEVNNRTACVAKAARLGLVDID